MSRNYSRTQLPRQYIIHILHACLSWYATIEMCGATHAAIEHMDLCAIVLVNGGLLSRNVTASNYQQPANIFDTLSMGQPHNVFCLECHAI